MLPLNIGAAIELQEKFYTVNPATGIVTLPAADLKGCQLAFIAAWNAATSFKQDAISICITDNAIAAGCSKSQWRSVVIAMSGGGDSVGAIPFKVYAPFATIETDTILAFDLGAPFVAAEIQVAYLKYA